MTLYYFKHKTTILNIFHKTLEDGMFYVNIYTTPYSARKG